MSVHADYKGVLALMRLGKFKFRIVFGRTSPLGETDFSRNTITLYLNAHVADTIIHECLHALYPKWSERKVRQRTFEIRKRLNRHKLRYLVTRYANKTTLL